MYVCVCVCVCVCKLQKIQGRKEKKRKQRKVVPNRQMVTRYDLETLRENSKAITTFTLLKEGRGGKEGGKAMLVNFHVCNFTLCNNKLAQRSFTGSLCNARCDLIASPGYVPPGFTPSRPEEINVFSVYATNTGELLRICERPVLC